MIRRLSLWAVAIFLTGAFAFSNPEEESYTRLARLSYMEGRVSFQHNSDVDWSAASVNLPLEPGDRIYTGSDGRAEIEFDDGSTFRLSENTDIEILSLQEELIQVRMSLGLSTLNVLGDANFEIDTPTAAFNAVRDGIYRFDVVENGDTDAIVRKGELEAANNQFSQRLRAGDLLHLALGDKGNPEISQYDQRDPWDEWNDRRNADLRVYGNQRYLPDNVYMGSSELDRYGRWVNVDAYGTAWVPNGMDPYWAPYSAGRWCYRPLYGWTWVSYEPWGWLPYHYGSWYHNSRYGWCWLPGPSFSFNFWSPGLVTFYNGPGWVSWCPLGPGDYYDIRNYHYRHGIFSHQIAELRGLHTRQPGDPFNRDVRGAFRTTQLDHFRDGSFDGKNGNTRWGNVDRPWSQGTLVKDRLNIQPTARSYSAATDRIAVRPSVTRPLPVVVRNTPVQVRGNQERFNQITNPQIRSGWSGGMRTRGEQGSDSRPNSRVIQVPKNPPTAAPVTQDDRRINSPRSSGRTNEAGRSQGGSTPEMRRQEATPSNPPEQKRQQNPSRNHIERAVPEQRQNTEPAAQPTPRSEFRQENSNSSVRQGISRWSDSGSDAAARLPESSQTYTAPRSANGGRWAESNSGFARPAESGNTGNRSMTQSENQVRSGSSNSGSGRSQEGGRTLSFSPPPSSRPSVERSSGGGHSSPAPARESGSSGKSAPESNSGRRH